MNYERQKRTPLLTAIKKYIESNPAPFDVPGHKMGRIENDLSLLIGNEVFKADVNAPIGIDNLYKGTGVIYEAEKLMAEAFFADLSIFLINGTTSGIMMMIMGCVNSGEKIILPRNVHKSAINALIVSGAIPVFVDPEYNHDLGIADGVTVETYITAMDQNPDAKAIFVINPTYFGVCSDLKTIVEAAHQRNIIVMVDEAHGAHLAFNDNLPLSAMQTNADISVLSLHKTCGSLTQSSAMLIKGKRVDYQRIRKAYTMFGSTSPSHILLSSLDATRKHMALHGKKILNNIIKLNEYAISNLKKIKGIDVLDKSYCSHDNSGRYEFDNTRLVIRVDGLNKSGFEIYKEIRKEYNIQLELAETNLVLALLAIGSTKDDVDRLVYAFQDLSQKYYKETIKRRRIPSLNYDYGEIAISPRQAYYSETNIVPYYLAEGEISSESVMIYPPGIPILIPGERISKDVINLYRFYLKSKGTIMQDSEIGMIKVVK